MNDNRKRLGIIGGMGSLAAVHFFRRVVERTPARCDQDHVEIVLHNNNHVPDRSDAILNGGADPRPELIRSCQLLEASGVDLIAIACMTSHAFLPDLQAATRTTILDGIAATARHCRRVRPDARRVGVLATTGSLQSGVFHRALAAEELEVVAFTGEEQGHRVMDPIYAEWGVKAGHVGGEARARLVAAARELVARGAELVIAGCTEVPLVVRQEDLAVPLVDATEVVVGEALERCLPPAG